MLALVTAGLVFAAAAQAQQAPPPGAAPHDEFASLDRNRDGYLSRLEAGADLELAKRFAAFDADKDARLSEEEYRLAKEDIARRSLADSAITARVKAALLAER